MPIPPDFWLKLLWIYLKYKSNMSEEDQIFSCANFFRMQNTMCYWEKSFDVELFAKAFRTNQCGSSWGLGEEGDHGQPLNREQCRDPNIM